MRQDKPARIQNRKNTSAGNKYSRPAAALLPNSELVSVTQILAAMNISASTWWDGVKKGKFPKAVKLGARTTRWRTED
jgi:predicted DNA-binding transcriptional regulator AlpA